jgi:COX assembly protein 1
MVIKCRKENNELKECLTKWYKDENFWKECTEEYLNDRAEYRRTGEAKKLRQFKARIENYM